MKDKKTVYPSVFLKRGREKRVGSGYLWIFSNEIEKADPTSGPGDVVLVYTDRAALIGTGYYNPHSLISIRMLSFEEEIIDVSFFKNRIKDSLERRGAIYPEMTTFRLLHGESDYLPGLIIDKYRETVNLRITAKGMEKLLGIVVEALAELGLCKNAYVSIDESVRKQEMIDMVPHWVMGSSPGNLEIDFGRLRFLINLEEGQKTGFFLDQRENRLRLADYVGGRDVLDCYCYTGAFSMYASVFGAKRCTGIDSSQYAVSASIQNALLNGIDNCDFLKEDVPGYIEGCARDRKEYGMIVLDPPSFVMNKKTFNQGVRKYSRINACAMRCVKKGGFMMTFSCSYHIDPGIFMEIIARAAALSGKRIQVLEYLTQARDHPVLPAMPQTSYLKGLILRVE